MPSFGNADREADMLLRVFGGMVVVGLGSFTWYIESKIAVLRNQITKVQELRNTERVAFENELAAEKELSKTELAREKELIEIQLQALENELARERELTKTELADAANAMEARNIWLWKAKELTSSADARKQDLKMTGFSVCMELTKERERWKAELLKEREHWNAELMKERQQRNADLQMVWAELSKAREAWVADLESFAVGIQSAHRQLQSAPKQHVPEAVLHIASQDVADSAGSPPYVAPTSGDGTGSLP